MEQQNAHRNILLRSKVMQQINSLNEQLEQIERDSYIYRLPLNPHNEEEYITEDYLNKKLKYELISARINKNK